MLSLAHCSKRTKHSGMVQYEGVRVQFSYVSVPPEFLYDM